MNDQKTMTEANFHQQFLGRFSDSLDSLVGFAHRYHEETEAYDRTVCTGPIGRDGGILPATPEQRWMINRNAIRVFKEIWVEAKRLGVSREELHEAIRKNQPNDMVTRVEGEKHD
jgi:hypothetical protein